MANYQDIIPIQLGQVALTTSYQTVYTTPKVTRTFVKTIDVSNTTSGIVTLYVSLVPSGGTAGTDNALFSAVTIPAYSTMQWTGTELMNAGGTLQAKASTTGVTLTSSGAEAT